MDYESIFEKIDLTIRDLLDLKKSLKKEFTDPVIETPVEENKLDSFEELKKILNSDQWPDAVNPTLIVDPNSENDKMQRGHGIIGILVKEDLTDKKFLDYGCGEGHCVKAASDHAKSAVGFDIKTYETWSNSNNSTFTASYDDAAKLGPYDVILIFDVLDHSVENSIVTLKKASELLTQNGKIYLRCHPWISRHGTHMYNINKINKAFAHVVFTPEEINKIDPNPAYTQHNIGVIYPVKSYENFIRGAGLEIITRKDTCTTVEPFFKIPKIHSRILANTKAEQLPEYQMSIDFIDYCLQKSSTN